MMTSVLFQVSTFQRGLVNYEPASIVILFVMSVSEFWLIILGRS